MRRIALLTAAFAFAAGCASPPACEPGPSFAHANIQYEGHLDVSHLRSQFERNGWSIAEGTNTSLTATIITEGSGFRASSELRFEDGLEYTRLYFQSNAEETLDGRGAQDIMEPVVRPILDGLPGAPLGLEYGGGICVNHSGEV